MDRQIVFNEGNLTHAQKLMYAQQLQKAGHLEKATLQLNSILAEDPNHVKAIHLLGLIRFQLGKKSEGIALLQKAITINPTSAELHNNIGNMYGKINLFNEAVAHFKQAIAINPYLGKIYYNLGNAFFVLKQCYEEALPFFEKALALNPTDFMALSNIIACRSHLCRWDKYDETISKLHEIIPNKTTQLLPFTILAYLDQPALIQQCNLAYAATKIHPSEILYQKDRQQNKKIKIAYISADFHNHATSYLMMELFEKHDRNRFEIIAISYGPDDKTPIRSRLVNAFDQFHDVQNKNDKAIAELIVSLKIDIAVDLKGYTKDARNDILAYRPAPIQVNYLGYPSTMGAPYIDYIIADETIIPIEHQPYYNEKVIYLPDCYQANDSKRSITGPTLSRNEAGLPDVGFIFCSFNNSWKITPTIFTIWLNLLKKIEKSVLWLIDDNDTAKNNLSKFAKERGVNPERLIFAKRIPIEQHYSRHYLADLFLDTLPCNAHTTASDALWTGLPLLTCLGNAFHSRVAASLLKAIHLPELITYNLSEYEALALKLANEPETLSSIRIKLQNNRETTPLFNTERFRKNIEKAYCEMWQIHHRGETPRHIRITP